MTMANDGWPIHTEEGGRSGAEIAPLADLAAEEVPLRDRKGRFLTGNSGGGRTKGSRNKLTDLVLLIVAEDFERHGDDALQRLREADPGSYLRLVGALVPRQLVLERERQTDWSELSIQEAEELIMRARQHRLIAQAMTSS